MYVHIAALHDLYCSITSCDITLLYTHLAFVCTYVRTTDMHKRVHSHMKPTHQPTHVYLPIQLHTHVRSYSAHPIHTHPHTHTLTW